MDRHQEIISKDGQEIAEEEHDHITEEEYKTGENFRQKGEKGNDKISKIKGP